MSAPIDVLAVIEGQELPEPNCYAWWLQNGDVEYTDEPYAPVAQKDWSAAAALYDADKVRAFARAVLSELIEADVEYDKTRAEYNEARSARGFLISPTRKEQHAEHAFYAAQKRRAAALARTQGRVT